ncbi:hypothetical protein PAMP_007293 [Pampus punctatissimus]
MRDRLCERRCENVIREEMRDFGKQLGGRRGCECITLEPSEMIVVAVIIKSLCLFFPLICPSCSSIFRFPSVFEG